METTSNRSQGVFTQISLFSVLLNGCYGGVCSIADVKKHGNMAIATMDRLDGEMQMIDGIVSTTVIFPAGYLDLKPEDIKAILKESL